MLDNKIFSQGMIRLSNIFYKTDYSEIYLKDVYDAICELTEEQFERTVKYLIKNHQSEYFPIPSQFLDAVIASRPTVQQTPEEKRIEPVYVNCPAEIKSKILNSSWYQKPKGGMAKI
jgi:hypothetical protein